MFKKSLICLATSLNMLCGQVLGASLSSGSLPAEGDEDAQDWYSESFLITTAGGSVLDMAGVDPQAHAAPFLADLNGDGKRDLIVGTYDGRFRFFQNLGTDSAPKFDENSTLLSSGDKDAMVPNWCCMAAGPQLLDVDGDSILDLTSGSYGGQSYWFKGLGGTRFSDRQTLVDDGGMPLIGRMEMEVGDYKLLTGMLENNLIEGTVSNLAANVAWANWNDDGIPDLIIGSGVSENGGQLFLRLGSSGVGIGSVGVGPGSPIPSQPKFLIKGYHPDTYEIKVAGEQAATEIHLAPSVADWDGDGLWDILLGSMSGRVYLLRNSGEIGEPKFDSREVLLEAGEVEQWMPEGTEPQLGARSQIHVADYNKDGKMDLLVGSWFHRSSPRPDLTKKEQRKVLELRQQMAALDQEIGLEPGIYRGKSSAFGSSPKSKDYYSLRTELEPFLETKTSEFYGRKQVSSSFQHSHIKVFLQK